MTSGTVPGGTPGRALRIALIVSLALNVLIIGGVATALVLSRHHGWKGHKHFGLLAFARTLPAERSEMIRKKVADEEATLSALRKAVREARVAARSLLTEEPFDAEKFKAALDRIADADVAAKRARMALLAAAAADMTPEERRQLHDWFAKRRARRGRDDDDDADKSSAPPAR